MTSSFSCIYSDTDFRRLEVFDVTIEWFALIVLFGCLGISGYYRYRARLASGIIERRREGGLVLALRALGGLSALAAIVVHALSPETMGWASFPSPGWVPRAGVILGLLTIPTVYWVFSSLGHNVSETVLTKDRHELVMSGPYRWVRHPLYTTGIMLLTATGLMLKSWLVLLFALVAAIVFRFVVVPIEERQLIAKFGDGYRRYMRRTGALLPRMKPTNPWP